MGRIIVTEFVSLDGVIEDPGGGAFEHAGWTFRFDRGDEGDQFKLQELQQSEAQLLGRETYELFAQAWPTMEDSVGFADLMNSMPKYVVSTTMQDGDATWENSTVIRGDVVREVRALKDAIHGDLLVAGSARLVQMLLQHGLVDELRLMVFPIVLGTGKRIFGELADPTTMALSSVKTVGEGIVIMTYQLAGADAATSSKKMGGQR